MDRKEESGSTCTMDSTIAPEDEGTVAEQITQEARDAMTNLAKEVTKTSANLEASDSDTINDRK